MTHASAPEPRTAASTTPTPAVPGTAGGSALVPDKVSLDGLEASSINVTTVVLLVSVISSWFIVCWQAPQNTNRTPICA